ncbi:carcinoembryonic antigen-related cell adhesion molecule 5-like [Xenia sp. Carnegie-2017]|uniref:carcinoembryonic antigen-related cell adhesion molecule 5-like n=1 Tax=Xenia sp. Carnegie-2017 TaxID=2897299 RepID=UPI001F03BA50|nr:carcinoembryonic antigen-related cell adhesion molecule 5-like [Xenia sp. Carnegie-2017]
MMSLMIWWLLWLLFGQGFTMKMGWNEKLEFCEEEWKKFVAEKIEIDSKCNNTRTRCCVEEKKYLLERFKMFSEICPLEGTCGCSPLIMNVTAPFYGYRYSLYSPSAKWKEPENFTCSHKYIIERVEKYYLTRFTRFGIGQHFFPYKYVLYGGKSHTCYVVINANPKRQGKPTVVINCSTPLVVSKGDNVSCVCRGEGGDPPANVTWFDKNNNIIGDVGVVNKTLVITNVTLNDGGSYKCKAQSYDDPGFRDQKSIEIQVKFKPTVSINCSSPLYVNENDSVSCVCRGEGGNPPANVTWFDKDNTTVRGFGVENATLVITNVTVNDNGSYRCKAQSYDDPGFRDQKSIEIQVKFKPTVSINCSSPLYVNESDSVSCVCRGEGGNPPANVTWFDKDNGTGREFGVESATLVITGASPNDRGSYRCKAESFNDTRFIDEKSIEIIVNYRPRNTTITISKINPKIDESVNKTCESDGFPPPTFIILRNNDFFSSGKTYTIKSVNISHNASYHCEAKNKLGNHWSDSLSLKVVNEDKDPTADEGKIKNLSLLLVGLLFCIMYELSW